MEEDPESEWVIQEYSSSNKDETSMMKWILNKGYGIGKKMMITGIAISAAPFVLPPIVVFSAMGVAFSVPSGLVFVTYACTNKLMRMLLPTPPSPILLLEYYSDGDEHVKVEGVDDCGKYVGASITNLDENIIGDGLCNENEEEKVQIAGYEEGEALIMNVDDFVVERSYYTNENVDEMEIKDVLPNENVIKDEEVEQIKDMKQEDEMRLGLDVASISKSDEDCGKYVGDSFTNLDENIVVEGFCIENEEEKVQVTGYEEKGEGLIMNVDEIVVEKRYYTNDNVDEKEIKEEVEKMEDMKKEIVTRIGLDGVSITNSDEDIDDDNKEDVHPYDYEQERDALLVNVDEVVVEKSYNTNESDDKIEMEDDVIQSESVTEEEEIEKINDLKHEVEMRFELDGVSITNSDEIIVGEGLYDDDNKEEEVQPYDYKQEREALVVNVDEVVDEKSYDSNENDDDKEMEDDVIQSENVTGSIIDSNDISVGKGHIEEEGQPDVHDQELEALIMYEIEKSYNISDVKAIEDDLLERENFVKDEESEVTEDIEEGVEMRLKSDAASIKDSDENIVEVLYDGVDKEELQADDEIEDERSNENGVENEMEDHVTKEDETEQMEDNKQEVDTRLGLDMGSVTNFGSGGGINEQGYAEDENENNMQEDEKEEVVEESTGLLEESASNVASGIETIEPVLVKEIECEKLIHNESNDNDLVGEMHHVVILTEGDEGNNFNSREAEELDLVPREVFGDSKKDGRKFKSDETVIRESMGTQEKTMNETVSNDETEEAKKETVISLNEDVRDEIGDESAIMNSNDLEAGNEVKENGADEDVDVLALPAFRQMVSDTNNGEVKADNDTKLPTKESLQDILDDEKIWEKIGAMRAIVGYNVPKQPTCIEELKALYLFTGVEPPVSFDGNLGLDEVNEKLKFLMSIVGVK